MLRREQVDHRFLSQIICASFVRRSDAQCSHLGYNLGRALVWHVSCFGAWIEVASPCHGVSVGVGEFTWTTMEERKARVIFLLLAAQLWLSSAQVLRIGKRNSCLRTRWGDK